MRNRAKISSGKQWTQREKEFLEQGLQNDLMLSELLGHLPGRSANAIIGQVHKLNYAERKQPNGDKTFIYGINHRGISTSTLAENANESVTANVSFEAYKDIKIIPQKLKNAGKELRMSALDLLYENGLEITDRSVKQASKLLSQYRIKEIACI